MRWIAIGTRPNAFITVRYSEKLLQAYGIHVTVPRLGWQMQSDRRGARQTAYRIPVAGDPQRLREGQADLWDSALKKESHFTLDGQAVSGAVHEVEAGEYHFVVS